MKINIKNHLGFALFTTLLFLQIISLLGIYALQKAAENMAMSKHIFFRDREFHEINSIAVQIENKLSQNTLHCLVEPLSMAELMHLPFSWWEENACGGNLDNIRYYYVIESLGIDACAVITVNNVGAEQVADYYRITFNLAAGNSKISSVIMQSIFVIPQESKQICTATKHQVYPGRQTWRELFR